MRRKALWLLISITLLLAGALTMVANNAAVVISDVGCGLLDGNGGSATADSSQSVTTSSGNGTLSCKASVDPASSGKAVHWDFSNTGLLCGTVAGTFTDDWQETVSASGQATLSCHVNG